MKKLLSMVAVATLVATLAGCANDGTLYRADTYQASQVNQLQEVRSVKILAINPARVAVSNDDNRQTSRLIGGVIGAIAGVAIANHGRHTDNARLVGGALGAGAGALAGDTLAGNSDTSYTDGVQLTFSMDGRTFQSVQVGKPCEYRTGPAIMATSKPGETRIQPNNPAGCAK